MRSIEFAYHSV